MRNDKRSLQGNLSLHSFPRAIKFFDFVSLHFVRIALKIGSMLETTVRELKKKRARNVKRRTREKKINNGFFKNKVEYIVKRKRKTVEQLEGKRMRKE